MVKQQVPWESRAQGDCACPLAPRSSEVFHSEQPGIVLAAFDASCASLLRALLMIGLCF